MTAIEQEQFIDDDASGESRSFVRTSIDRHGCLISPMKNARGEYDTFPIHVRDSSAFGIGIDSTRALPIGSFWRMNYVNDKGKKVDISLVITRRGKMHNGFFEYGAELRFM